MPISIPQETWAPSKAILRRIFSIILRTDSDFESLLIDHFEHIFEKISPAMDRTSKVNILLFAVDTNEIWRKLKRHYTKQIEANIEFLSEDFKESNPNERSINMRKQLEQLYHDRDVLRKYRADNQVIFVEESIKKLRQQIWNGSQPQENDVLDDRFVLLQELGKGGFGTVWLGIDRRSKKTPLAVAIKILHGQHNANTTTVERFKRNATRMKLLSKLSRSVVSITQEPTFDGLLGCHYYVMEHQPNGTLSSAISDRKLDTKGGLRAIAEVCRALEMAHERSIIHRDLKPSNILLDSTWSGMLCDFDSARDLNDSIPSSIGHYGTVGYAAPECLEREQNYVIDHRADLFGIAKTVIFALTAKHPNILSYQNTKELLAQLDIDQKLIIALMNATEIDPNKRTGTISDFRQTLEDYLGDRPSISITADYQNEYGDNATTVHNIDVRKIQILNIQAPRFDHDKLTFLSAEANYILRILTGEQRGLSFPIFPLSAITIGRAQASDFPITDELVSRNHAVLREDAGVVIIEDTGSANGTYVNAIRIKGERRLSHGDRIAIGNVILELVQTDKQ